MKKTFLVTAVVLCLVASVGFAASVPADVTIKAAAAASHDETPAASRGEQQAGFLAPDGIPTLRRGAPEATDSTRIEPHLQRPQYLELQRFEKVSDYPTGDSWGNGIVVPEGGTISRSNVAFGIQMRGIYGGGCVPLGGPSQDTSGPCLSYPGPDGKPVYVYKERERWIAQTKYLDRSVTPAVERLVAGPNTLNYVDHTPKYFLNCFVTAFNCDYYGIPLNPLIGWTTGKSPDCGFKRGAGYRTSVFYQYSQYRTTTDVPAGANEWEPAAVPATATTLAVPGKEIAFRNWELTPRENALRVTLGASRINPAIPWRLIDRVDTTVTNVGGTKTRSIPAGSTQVSVEAFDCGVPFTNVTFKGTVTYVAESGGHIHSVSGDTPPPSGKVSDAPTADGFEGTTDASGRWPSPLTVTAGEFAGAYELVVETDNLTAGNGSPPLPFRSPVQRLVVGFPPLPELLPAIGSDIELVGDANENECGSGQCDNHRYKSHFGTPELHAFIYELPRVFHENVATEGSLLINDMSLPSGGGFDIAGDWADSYHISHRNGYDVDVNRKIYLYDGGERAITNWEEMIFYSSVKRELQGSRINEPTIHFRLSGEVIDQIFARGY